MTNERFEFGDRVRHTRRPEWGIGSVIRTEQITVSGKPAQRLAIRFDNAGLKRLVSTQAGLQRVTSETEDALTNEPAESASRLEAWEKLEKSDWLGPLAQRKIEETMVSLPESVRDPFLSLDRQLTNTFNLYRFDRSGRGLIDWAVAQSGLKDPLSRFTRQELEQLFDRWAHNRDAHLSRLLSSARYENDVVDKAIRTAPKSAREAVRRCMAMR